MEGGKYKLAGLGSALGFTPADLKTIKTEGTEGAIWPWILVEGPGLF